MDPNFDYFIVFDEYLCPNVHLAQTIGKGEIGTRIPFGKNQRRLLREHDPPSCLWNAWVEFSRAGFNFANYEKVVVALIIEPSKGGQQKIRLINQCKFFTVMPIENYRFHTDPFINQRKFPQEFIDNIAQTFARTGYRLGKKVFLRTGEKHLVTAK